MKFSSKVASLVLLAVFSTGVANADNDFGVGLKAGTLGLGLGAHFCMGAPLARLEMRVILEQLTKRLPNMRLVDNQDWQYLPTLVFRGVQRLEVEW